MEIAKHTQTPKCQKPIDINSLFDQIDVIEQGFSIIEPHILQVKQQVM